MRVLVAGASGAIGRPLVARLMADGHTVIGLTNSERGLNLLSRLGVEPVAVNALNADAVHAAIAGASPDVVIDELTSLPITYSPQAMRITLDRHRRLRMVGGANVQQAAREAGARRLIVQSGCWLAAPGPGFADENTPFASDAPPVTAATAHLLADVENRVLQATKIEVAILRYGIFYGPGTWFTKNASIADSLHRKDFPIAGHGQGVWSFVHVEDAAAATAAAVNGAPGIYNVVDDQPSEFQAWLPAFAHWLGAPPPPHMTEEEALRRYGPDFVYSATRYRGASNHKARTEFAFQPRRLEWLAAVAR